VSGAAARLWLAPESVCLPPLLAAARLEPSQAERMSALARELLAGAPERGIEAFTRRLPLASPAGAALLSLAEALLRVPDAGNAERLIRDQLGGVDWRQAEPGGLLGALLGLAAASVGPAEATASGALRRGVSALATPLVRGALYGAMRALSGRFVYAERIETALARARRERASTGHASAPQRYSFDMLGEAALTAADAEHYLQAYEHAIHAVGAAYRGHGVLQGGGVSVKLSALHPRYSDAQRMRVMAELLPRLRQLARSAQRYELALTIDAEESERLELSLELIEALMSEPELRSWAGLGVAVQAYQKRAPAVIEHLIALAARRGPPLLLRLVKGAYWDAEIKRAQLQGLAGFPVYSRKVYTDVAYLACARRMLAAPAQLVPQFATHNAQTVAELLVLAQDSGAPEMEFQRLYGMGETLYARERALESLGRPVRLYAPVGERATLLAYLMRRLLENGAAASFVHRAASGRRAIDGLIADPVVRASALGSAPHPQIRAPRALFEPERRNSLGIDLADAAARAPLLEALVESRGVYLTIEPLLATDELPGGSPERTRREVRNPADRSELLGTVIEAHAADVELALAAAAGGARAWAETEVEQRAQLLERAADLYEADAPALIALAVREAGKTLGNGLDEVREAVDLLRYYSARIRAEFDHATHLPLGPVVCISPWNFPLAIFTGQIAAALAAGNTVLAKPAEQTNAIASRAVRWLHRAGIPRSALQLLPGTGERIGARLVADSRVQGVVFTGSTEAARSIARALAARGGEVPLIAETGGQNAMIVDSTALPEQVVTDVLRSAFDCAGQRCSALRVLCLQQEIAAPMLAMLEGAMRELRVGDPADIATDVGPMIDEPARERIRQHLRTQRAPRAQAPLAPECERGVFQAPTLLEIDSLDQLRHEVFGPVLHVLRFERSGLGALVDAINATGYGLTLGIASRIGATARAIAARALVGNVYVNRNMIGAVVGVQPFGGRGLSGTGPKAGGPLYLHRLLRVSPGPPLPGAGRSCPPLQALIRWLQSAPDAALSIRERQALSERLRHYALRTPLGLRLSLPGYVGECNELSLRARGTLRATARSPAALLEQLAAALATGNSLVADEAALASRLREVLPLELRGALVTPAAGYDLVLVDGEEALLRPEWLQGLRGELVAREGPIVPIVVSEDGYALERLLFEQTVSVNTAAVGGDAQLLSLPE
jgi:RHH-type proline utilization regulon transcriptional repressor/proline dehydrogenase/delta 1-pyrroline-5-carboxylate dehydrogenase